jgi:hypothetical protein
MRVLACLLLVACGGGGSDPVEGEPLIASSLMAQHDNKPWTPMFGFGRTKGSTFELFFGQQEISCSDNFEDKPRDGNYGAAGVPAPLVVGTYGSASFQSVEVKGNDVDAQLGTGNVMITTATATELSAVLAFSATVGSGQFSLTGAVTAVRCP